MADIHAAGTFKGQRYLVVGGTKGIGRGIALKLAQAGASVDVVGRSGGDSVVNEMMKTAVKLKSDADFNFHAADLSTTSACASFVLELQKSQHTYAGLVMTLGVWPDFSNPATPEDYDRVVFIDIIARFLVLRGMISIGALEDGAIVQNVLAAGMANEDNVANVKLIKGAFGREKDRHAQLEYMKGVVAPAGDIMLWQAAAAYPQFRYIGTNPGEYCG